MDKMSLREFFSAPTRYLAESISKESEFEKPYLDENPRKMHLDFPTPDWPSFSLPGPFPDIPGPVPGLSLCAITCYAPSDCDEPIWCHPSIWCGNDLGCTLCSWIVEGATSGYTPHLTGVGGWGIDIWIDDTLVETGGEALIHVQMTDPCGNLCGEDIEVTCKKCPPDVVMTWDTVSSAETIGQSDNVSVYVKDGLGPYNWSVSGTGFSLNAPVTSGLANVLRSDGSACGSATITVTDFCEDTAIGYVRCTADSEWVLKAPYDTCVISGPASYFTGSFVFEYIAGNKRQTESIIYQAGASGKNVNCATYGYICDNYCDDGTCLSGSFIESGGANITPNCQPDPSLPDTIRCYCGEFNMDYFEWECL